MQAHALLLEEKQGLNIAVFTRLSSRTVGGNVLKAFALPHQRPLQDDATFLVALTFLRGELVHPAELTVAVFAADISHHVSPSQHDSVLHLAVL